MAFPGRKSDSKQADWVTEATGFLTRFVDGVHDKAVVPLATVVRAIVYGLLAAILGIGALVFLCIGFIRLLDVYLDNIPGAPEGVWLADVVGGAIFVLAGLLLWSKRKAKTDSQ